MATIGIVLSVGGAAAAFVALRLMRAESCPTCGAVGSLVVLRLVTEDAAALGLNVVRYRRCAECGAVLKDRRPAERTTDRPRLSALAQHSAR